MKNEQYILLFSHGQTIAQQNKVFSDMNTPMTDKGRNEVVVNIENIKSSDITYAKVFCSPLPRAIETAQIISSNLSIPLEIIPELAQQDFGKYTGQPNTPENNTLYIQDLLNETGQCEPISSVLKNLEKSVRLIMDTKENSIVVAHRFTWLGFELYFSGTLYTPELVIAPEKKVFSRLV